jgi:hypothetical protein
VSAHLPAARTASLPEGAGPLQSHLVLPDPDLLDGAGLGFEPVGMAFLVVHHLLEHGGGAVVAEVVALLGGGVELREGGFLAG